VRISERCDGGTAVFDEDSDDLIIVELSCNRCHRVHGHFLLGTKVHR